MYEFSNKNILCIFNAHNLFVLCNQPVQDYLRLYFLYQFYIASNVS